ncbi:hypothetical protein BJ165DRAFT_1515052 [Panaeolus papilionaceus]|nr:hypothetical protein BJ165DRAFT_1515052 [Panaeolus papilionaceus]
MSIANNWPDLKHLGLGSASEPTFDYKILKTIARKLPKLTDLGLDVRVSTSYPAIPNRVSSHPLEYLTMRIFDISSEDPGPVSGFAMYVDSLFPTLVHFLHTDNEFEDNIQAAIEYLQQARSIELRRRGVATAEDLAQEKEISDEEQEIEA